MRKRLTLLLAIAMAVVMVAGCAPRSNEPQPTPSPSIDVDSLDHSVQQYGDTESLILNDDLFSCNIMFPFGKFNNINSDIQKWAQATLKDAQKEVMDAHAEDDTVEGELNVNYNSYVIGDRYAGIQEVGFFSHSGLAHPVDIVKSFNIDLSNGKFITAESLFPNSARQEVLGKIKEKLIAKEPSLDEVIDTMSSEWLENPVLNGDGVNFMVARGVLPSAFGMQMVELSYDELDGLLTLPSSNRPTPSPIATATPQPTQEPPATTPSGGGSIDPNKPMVALTFDDGPSATTPHILDLLTQYGGKATFCMIGNRVVHYSDAAKKVIAQGSEIASHTWDHKKLTALSGEDLKNELVHTNETIFSVVGVRPRFLRPPYGSIDDEVKEVCKELGMSIVRWNIDTEDWKTKDAQKTYDAIMNNVKDGDIILCHDLYKQTGEAMERVIPELISRGFQLVTVSELLEHTQGGIQPGHDYRHR